MKQTDRRRTEQLISVLDEAFSSLMEADPAAFRVKYRKMAADPYAFYRGTACLFYADMTGGHSQWDDDYVDDHSSRIWIHGDLHAENFGTYMNSDGRLVFDVNDFDEAYIGHFTWDLQRFAASLALLGWRKALPEDEVRALVGRYSRGYLTQVNRYLETEDDDSDFSLSLANTDGPIQATLQQAREATRVGLLDPLTSTESGVRRFNESGGQRRLSRTERSKVEKAYARYLESIPEDKRIDREVFYDVRDIVAVSGFGIGSAGLPAYNLLLEGYNQAQDNDVVLSMKQANIPAVSRFVDSETIDSYFDNEAHRTVASQHALQVHTDPLLGHTTIDGVGFVVAELSPYEADFEWDDLHEPSEIGPVVEQFGRATAKVHCASDDDSDQSLVNFSVEHAIAGVLEGKRKRFESDLADFAIRYADAVRHDHALFVEAFRTGAIGVAAV